MGKVSDPYKFAGKVDLSGGKFSPVKQIDPITRKPALRAQATPGKDNRPERKGK